MIQLTTSLAVFVFAQTRAVPIPPWLLGLAAGALLVFLAWRGLRWFQGRGATRAHQTEISARQQRAQVVLDHMTAEKNNPAAKPAVKETPLSKN